jgi:hypothetical protein
VLADVWLATDATVAPAVSLRTVVSDMTESLARFNEQLDASLNIAGPALSRLVTEYAASAGPLQADLSRSLAAQLSAFFDQNSAAITPLAAAPMADLLSKDQTLTLAAADNGSVDTLKVKPTSP